MTKPFILVSDCPFDINYCNLRGIYGGVRLFVGQGVDHGTILYIPEHIQYPGFAVCSEQTLEATDRVKLGQELKELEQLLRV